MASLQALGSGPLSVLDSNGAQHVVPLTLISFGPGNVPTCGSGVPSAIQTILNPLLPSLVSQGFIWSAPPPAAAPVFTITAVEGGTIGDAINITFSNPVGATSTTPAAVDVSVSVNQVYSGLTLATVGAVIGTSANGGSTPGLAFLATTGKLTELPIASVTPFTLQDANYIAAIPSGVAAAPTAFTLQALNAQADALNLSVVVSAVTASTFTMTVKWQKTVPAVPLKDLTTLNNQFGFVLKFAPPPIGAPPAGYAPPAAGTITLQGGVDPVIAGQNQPAVSASATAVSG
jgi:hypothetical protein